MSGQAQDWARKVRDIRSATKFVLLSLANYANHHNEVWVSCAQLIEDTNLDRKSVLANVRLLIEFGLIADTGKRVGRTGQVIVYKLELSTNSPNFGTVKESQKRDCLKPETVPDLGLLEAGKSPVFHPKESRFSPETVPNLGHVTLRNPKEPISALNACDARKPEPPVDKSTAVVDVDESDELAIEWQHLSDQAPNDSECRMLGKLVAEGVRVEHLRLAWQTARTRKPAPERVPVAYVVPIMRDALAGRLPLQRLMQGEAANRERDWMHDNDACTKKAQALGIGSRVGETWPQLRSRIAECMAAGGKV